MKVIVEGKTDRGRRRTINEDAFGIFNNLNLYLVADGMGGHAAGNVASRIAVETVSEYMQAYNLDRSVDFVENKKKELSECGRQLNSAIQMANKRIYNTTCVNQHYAGMGTTLVALFLSSEQKACIGHVGDSRIYLYRDNGISLLTSDHSWVNIQVMMGAMTQEEARHHAMRNVITRALGTSLKIDVDIIDADLKEGDIFLLCSDGLTNLITDSEIADHLAEFEDANPRLTNSKLVSLANARGGPDNITVIVVKILEP